MKTVNAYCSACDQEVRLVLTDEPIADDPSPIHDREVVCLEIGEHCTGAMCPIGAVPPVVMAARLVRNGLQTTMQPIMTAMCPACDGRADFVIVSREYCICSVCGTTSRRESIFPKAVC
ncbi:MAG: hypothetical protein WEA80_10560 [Gemmatimonadaceae bacterium]